MRAFVAHVLGKRGARTIAPLLAGLVVVAVVVAAAAARHGAGSTPAALPALPSGVAAPVTSPPVSSAPVSSAPASSTSVSSAPMSSGAPPPPSASSLSNASAPPVASPSPLAKQSLAAATWRNGGVAVFTATDPPQSSMIGGANDLLAVGATVLAATEQGIARSSDSGATWRNVLTGVDMWAITRAGSGFAALGKRGGPYDNGPAVVATSSDGVSWQLIDPQVPQSSEAFVPFGYGDRIAATGFDAHAVVVAVPDIVASSAGGDTLRSVDGGRTWVKLSTWLNTGIDVLPDGVTMYATGTGSTDSCEGAVYRSTDAGAHWTLLPGSCQNRPLYAVTFVDADHGFAAGGTPAKYDGSDLVEATDDGGRTWQVRWSTPLDPAIGGGGGGFDNEIIRLVFADAKHGYALSGGCVDGQNGPCGGNLYVTSDAGYSWHTASRVGVGVAAAGADVYLSGLPQSNGPSLAVSNDAGTHWTLHSSATQVSSQSVAGIGDKLWWQTNIGTYTSNDAGQHWTPSTAAAIASLPMYDDPLQAAPPNDLLTFDRSAGAIWSSTDGAATARESSLVLGNAVLQAVALGSGGRAAAIAGFDDECSSPQLIAKMEQVKPGWQPETRPSTLYLSSDAGAHWQRAPAASLPFPFSAFAPGSLAISSSLVVAMDACTQLEISHDAGTTWSTIAAPTASSGCTVSLLDNEIWLDCTASVSHSSDAGATWTTYVTNPGGVQRLSQPLQPIGRNTAIVSAAGSLWRTTDGGAHWTQSWPALNGES